MKEAFNMIIRFRWIQWSWSKYKDYLQIVNIELSILTDFSLQKQLVAWLGFLHNFRIGVIPGQHIAPIMPHSAENVEPSLNHSFLRFLDQEEFPSRVLGLVVLPGARDGGCKQFSFYLEPMILPDNINSFFAILSFPDHLWTELDG